MSKRVAIAGFLHETNTFAPSPARLSGFEQGGGYMPMSRGDEILVHSAGINLSVAGAVEHGRQAEWDLVPLLWTGAIPSAHVTREAYETIVEEIVAGVVAAGPLDGIYLDLHGAMVAEHVDDGEGELLARVRRAVGPGVMIAASLDLHGNVTERMVDEADVLVAFRTYPHIDMAETGRRAAVQLDRSMERGRSFSKAFRRIPYLIPIPWQCTSLEPARSLYAQVTDLEAGPVSSTSLLTGFPAADFEGCAPTVLAYGEDEASANAAADAIESAMLAAESSFAGKAYMPEEAVAEAMRIAESAKRPVIIADTQDNPGAGGDSDTMGMVRALLAKQATRAAVGLIVDPASAEKAHAAGEGAKVRLSLGGHSGIEGDAPLEAEFTVETLSEGRFKATGPYYGGAAMNLGPSACLAIDGVRIVVCTHKAQMADREMYRFVGIEPEDQAILVNKSSVHFRADFEPIAETILVATAPGPMLLDPADLPFTRLSPGTRLSPCGPAFVPPKEAKQA